MPITLEPEPPNNANVASPASWKRDLPGAMKKDYPHQVDE